MNMLHQTFNDKTVLVTGHTGFKGAWLSLWLSHLGARVVGLALDPDCEGTLYDHLSPNVFQSDLRCDIRQSNELQHIISKTQPDYVFHLAAQPLVLRSYVNPIETLTTNIIGSANVLDAVRMLEKQCHTIFVTSDKCYQNHEWLYSYRETDRLGGKDPYSMSKAAAELVAECWRRSFFDAHPSGSKVISVRAGNVIGGGDYSANRILPDCVRAVLSKQQLTIRSPKATRPWQHVIDCLHGYLTAARKISELADDSSAESFNFGPKDAHEHSVLQVVEKFFTLWKSNTAGFKIEHETNGMHEAGYLSVSIDKAQRLLGWQPVWDFNKAIGKTVDWYHTHHAKKTNMEKFTLLQLEEFMKDAENN